MDVLDFSATKEREGSTADATRWASCQLRGELMPIVEVCFPIQLRSIARDHGYILFSAISRAVPVLHVAKWLGVHTLEGRIVDEGVLDLGRRPHLRLRLPAEGIVEVLPLSGAVLEIAGSRAVVGAPTVYPLNPSSSVDARMVAIKLTRAPHRENALEAARRLLARVSE